LFNRLGLLPEDKMVTIAAGAKSHIKRWMISGFIRLCERLSKEYTLKILLVGDDNDRATNKMIADKGIKNVYDITGQTNIRELAYLISLCRVLVTNDSAPMHVASAVNTPTVAIFGPTDPAKYGPLAARSITIRKDLRCSPCQKALCKFNLECMSSISSEEVVDAVSKVSKL
jgi:lipopolysaccharide heptosyltransferase II